MFVIAVEVFISKDDRIIGAYATIYLTKAPSIKLAGKAGKFGGLEKLRNDGARELIGIADDKRLSVRKPGDAVVRLVFSVFLHIAHHFHELFNKIDRLSNSLLYDGKYSKFAVWDSKTKQIKNKTSKRIANFIRTEEKLSIV